MTTQGHHLILGELEDIITGEILQETHDERFRQDIAAGLIRRKGYNRDDIKPRWQLTVKADEKCAVIKIDFGVVLNDRTGMIIRYGPGSLVTRHRPALAASRMLTPHQIPVVVVTNGVEADILDGTNGRLTATGLDAIPEKETLLQIMAGWDFPVISPDRFEKESRIIYAFEVDGSCPCDDTICRIQ